MSAKKPSEFSKQLGDVIEIASHGRRTEAHNTAPDFEANVARVREFWNRAGIPALRELQAAIDQFSPDFDNAARLDFDGLRSAGCPLWRVESLQAYVAEARNFMRAALEQLSRIPGKIESLRPEDEEPWIVNNKGSQRIEYELRSVLAAAEDLRQRHERMRHQIAQLSHWLQPSMLRPAAAQGAGDAN